MFYSGPEVIFPNQARASRGVVKLDGCTEAVGSAHIYLQRNEATPKWRACLRGFSARKARMTAYGKLCIVRRRYCVEIRKQMGKKGTAPGLPT